MKLLKKRKGSVYDPKLPPALPPFKSANGLAKCDLCEKTADTEVSLKGVYFGFLCKECEKKALPYPYNGAEEPPKPDGRTERKSAGVIFEEGMRYFAGEGVEQDKARALELFTDAARLGHAEAQHNVGLCHRSGKYGKTLDLDLAAWWFEKAAEQGYVEAQHDLGLRYFKGGGGRAPDFAKAVKWFARAAEAGHAAAQNDLGKCFADGKGVEQDFKKAKEWFKKSAKQGNADAIDNLEKLKDLKKR